mmetsp:Transcript_77105/g.160500  ORF Transcript_77105/g.160500 Transcript_77105/m.160500 type:complete len:278 (+) Transcript_77105:1393-2226(+)
MRVIPVSAGHVIFGNFHLDLRRFAGVHEKQDVVGVALGRDVEAVEVEVRVVQLADSVHVAGHIAALVAARACLHVGPFAQLVAELDLDGVARVDNHGLARNGSTIGPGLVRPSHKRDGQGAFHEVDLHHLPRSEALGEGQFLLRRRLEGGHELVEVGRSWCIRGRSQLDRSACPGTKGLRGSGWWAKRTGTHGTSWWAHGAHGAHGTGAHRARAHFHRWWPVSDSLLGEVQQCLRLFVLLAGTHLEQRTFFICSIDQAAGTGILGAWNGSTLPRGNS